MKSQNALIVMNLQNKFITEKNKHIFTDINNLLHKCKLIIFIKRIEDPEIIDPAFDFYPDLDISKCKKDFYIFKNSGEDNIFNITELKDFLSEHGVTDVHLCGVSVNKDIEISSKESLFLGYRTSIIYSKL